MRCVGAGGGAWRFRSNLLFGQGRLFFIPILLSFVFRPRERQRHASLHEKRGNPLVRITGGRLSGRLVLWNDVGMFARGTREIETFFMMAVCGEM